jgi:hypothetical protein
VPGVRGVVILKRPLELVPAAGVTSDCRRAGVATEDVERVRLDIVRVRTTGGGGAADSSVLGLVDSPATVGLASPSVHCKCKITDLVAHF